MSLSLPRSALRQVVSLTSPQFPALSNEDNSDAYLIAWLCGVRSCNAKCSSRSWHGVSARHYSLPPALLLLARDTPLHLHLAPPSPRQATGFLLLTSSSAASAGMLSIYILAGMSLCIV